MSTFNSHLSLFHTLNKKEKNYLEKKKNEIFHFILIPIETYLILLPKEIR